MIEQDAPYYFAEELEEIKQIYIKTSYGNIFAHAVGTHGQPLIIVTHGSGPKNSSDEYLYFLHEYLVRISYIEKFFVVAIDCPGYGRSKGSKQAVKTFPLQMFKQILADLGYKSYYAMMGHSQGGAATFNAVFDDPSLTDFMLMDRPVCGNIKRFNKFPLPTLLIYDIEDDGHPIWQGKLLYKELLKSELYTYRGSRNPYWVPDNIWNLILSFVRRHSAQRKSIFTSQNDRSNVRALSESPSKRKPKNKSQQKSQPKIKSHSLDKCEEIKKEKIIQQKLMEIKEVEKSEFYSQAVDLEQFEELPSSLNQPKMEESQEDVRREEEKKEDARREEEKKRKILEIQKSKEEQKATVKQSNENQSGKEQIKNEEKKQMNKSEDEDKCSICHQKIYYPVETNCKHIFCKKCIGQSYLVDQRCPLCRTVITKRNFKEPLQQQLLQKMTEQQILQRQQDLNKFERMLKSIIYIEIGNTSRELLTKKSHFSKTKKKYVWEIYVKEPKNFKFEEVSFNINMGDPSSKPVKVTNAPFTFESRGTFSFSCQITIKPKSKDYAKITSIYRIDVTPGNHTKTIALKRKG